MVLLWVSFRRVLLVLNLVLFPPSVCSPLPTETPHSRKESAELRSGGTVAKEDVR